MSPRLQVSISEDLESRIRDRSERVGAPVSALVATLLDIALRIGDDPEPPGPRASRKPEPPAPRADPEPPGLPASGRLLYPPDPAPPRSRAPAAPARELDPERSRTAAVPDPKRSGPPAVPKPRTSGASGAAGACGAYAPRGTKCKTCGRVHLTVDRGQKAALSLGGADSR